MFPCRELQYVIEDAKVSAVLTTNDHLSTMTHLADKTGAKVFRIADSLKEPEEAQVSLHSPNLLQHNHPASDLDSLPPQSSRFGLLREGYHQKLGCSMACLLWQLQQPLPCHAIQWPHHAHLSYVPGSLPPLTSVQDCLQNLGSSLQPEHGALVVYTSGTTGRPKGISLPQGLHPSHPRWPSTTHVSIQFESQGIKSQKVRFRKANWPRSESTGGTSNVD